MHNNEIFAQVIEEKKQKGSEKKPHYGLRKLSVGLVSCILGFTMVLNPVSAITVEVATMAAERQVHYEVAGEENIALDYARTDYTYEDADGIHLTVTKWARFSHLWGGTKKGPYNGRYILNFFDEDFYTQIESVSVENSYDEGKYIQFEKEANGALWKIPINIYTFDSALIGVVTNHNVIIKLKNGATIESLGFADTKINFTTLWVRGDGKAEKGGYDNGFILKNNPNVPEYPAKPADGNEHYLPHKGSAFSWVTDGTESCDGKFANGYFSKIVDYDAKNKVLKSVVSFKPMQDFLESNTGWVLYINEVIPAELLKYIDTDSVYLGLSDTYGNFKTKTPIKIVVNPNGDGHITTKDTPELSIVGGDWEKVEEVRNRLENDVFKAIIGQRRSYTIQYNLKADVDNIEFAQKLNDYLANNNEQLNFESWLEADFVDSTDEYLRWRKPDGGKPNKRLMYTHATSYLEVLDTDKDGLFDFVEDELGTDKYEVDTDGDGVPDGVEVLEDNTNPKDAKSYLVVAPNAITKEIDANKDQVIIGTVPKTIYKDPSDETVILKATNPEAGNVIVRAYKFVDGDVDYTNNEIKAETTIPFADLVVGNFSIDIPVGTFSAGDKIVLVAFSPDGKNPMMSTVPVFVSMPDTVISNGTQEVIEGNAIKDIVITPGDPDAVVTVDEDALPDGVTFDEDTNTISGTPEVDDWGKTEEEREFKITVTVENSNGETEEHTVVITVLRDTDNDGDPDITDPDDDGDGFSDEDEITAGTDPKDPDSKPDASLPPVIDHGDSTPGSNQETNTNTSGSTTVVDSTPAADTNKQAAIANTGDSSVNLLGVAATAIALGALAFGLGVLKKREDEKRQSDNERM